MLKFADNWVVNADQSIQSFDTIEYSPALTMRVQWTKDLDEFELLTVKSLLDEAYTKRSMWPYFSRCKDETLHRLVFTLHHKDNGVVSTRSIGEVLPEDNYWEDEVIKAVGYNSPVAGGSYTTKRSERGHGYGALIFKSSTAWMINHAKAPVIFGDTVSRKALEIYIKSGAFMKQDDIDKLCARYDARDLDDVLYKTKQLEEIDWDYGVNYAWCFDKKYQSILNDHGYTNLKL